MPVAPRVRRRRRVGLVAVTASLALVAGAGAYVVTHTRFTSFGILSPAVAAESVAPPFPPGTPGAYRNASWYPQHKRDLRYLWTVATAWDPFSMLRIHDVATPTVNVVDGHADANVCCVATVSTVDGAIITDGSDCTDAGLFDIGPEDMSH